MARRVPGMAEGYIEKKLNIFVDIYNSASPCSSARSMNAETINKFIVSA